jgi:hypothetical protein
MVKIELPNRLSQWVRMLARVAISSENKAYISQPHTLVNPRKGLPQNLREIKKRLKENDLSSI